MIRPVSLAASILPLENQIEAYVLRRLLVEKCLSESELIDGLSDAKKQDHSAHTVFDRLCQSGLLARNNAGSLLIRKKARLRVGTVTDGSPKKQVVSVKGDETYFKYNPIKKFKKETIKKVSSENPFKILKNLNLG